MNLASARVTLKLNSFEIGAAVLLAIAAGLWAAFNHLQVQALAAPDACVRSWIANGPTDADGCGSVLQAWTQLLDTTVIGPMAYLPFAIGLLSSVPIVARELEARTAQTAWSLYPSRTRWLLRQVGPILPIVGLALAFAAFQTSALESDRAVVGYSPVVDLGDYGPIILARAFGGFGVGLLVGALLGRTLPAFVFGAVVVLGLTLLIASARQVWMENLTPTVISEMSSHGGTMVVPTGVATAVAFRTPDGRQVSLDAARAIAHAAGAPQPNVGDEQDTPAAEWLQANGYTELALGVTREMALGWGPYDALGYVIAGLAAVGAAMIVVNQKRPT